MLDNIRPYTEQDRDHLIALDVHPKAIGQPGHHIFIDDESGAAVLWIEANGGHSGYLAGMVGSNVEHPTFYALVKRACAEAIERDVQHGAFEIRSPALMRLLQRTFDIKPEVTSWRDGKPVSWVIEVDLQDAIRQLEQVV